MRRYIKYLIAGTILILTFTTVTGCASEEEKKAAAKYQAEAEKYEEGNNYEVAQKSMKKALEQTPGDKELKKAADKLDAKAKKMRSYTKTMEAAIAAIEADDAKTLHELQESDAGKSLAEMVGEEGSYIYIPKGGKTGKGIGYYTYADCDCDQWYYGDYKNGKREGKGIWYYASENSETELYKEVYNGEWSKDKPNGKGHQYEALGDTVYTDQNFTVKNGLFEGTYEIKDTLEDGTEVTGSYTLKNGMYETISDEDLKANNFEIPSEPHFAIAYLYDAEGKIRSCTMVYSQVATKGVLHFREALEEAATE